MGQGDLNEVALELVLAENPSNLEVCLVVGTGMNDVLIHSLRGTFEDDSNTSGL